MEQQLVYQELTHQIIAGAIEVHKSLGPGLLETAYSFCLEAELKSRRFEFKREVIVPVVYKDVKIDCGFRVDFLIEDQVILEIKSVESLLPIHESQLLTYLRFANKKVGLLINFNETMLKRGIKRLAI